MYCLPISELSKKIASGEIIILSEEQISNRIGISIEMLRMWIENSSCNSFHDYDDDDEEENNKKSKSVSFPKRDIEIAGLPRWFLETIEKWLNDNIKDRSDFCSPS